VARAEAKGRAAKRGRAEAAPPRRRPLWWRILRVPVLALAGAWVLLLLVVGLFAWVNPPQGLYMRAEAARLGAPVARAWVGLDAIAPVMARSAVAAEDANFCLHWGFDMAAIRSALDEGRGRGASTITQQVVKNVFLWHGRTWTRKALEAVITPVVEALWSKRRILEVYLNIAEFDAGVFGVQAAAGHYFGTTADRLTPQQAARLAAILPAPKSRDAANPSRFVRTRAAAIMDGAETIRRDGRAACFE
jgi:monofunctional biosynthetic peptidoglycan transglycosylase